MTAPLQGVCSPWTTEADVCSPLDDYSFPAGLIDDSINAASDVLFELSGRRFAGSCMDIVRPTKCSPSCRCWGGGNYSPRDLAEWDWPCSCDNVPRITLGGYPVTQIMYVKVDGAVLDPSLYRIDDFRYLTRLPNAQNYNPGWYCCARTDLATTEMNTFEVEFVYGVEPPAMGKRAAAVLAGELALGCQPEYETHCRLPRKVQAITRQGVTMVLTDPSAILTEGRTGLYEVDLFLQTYNPGKVSRRAVVVSPDIPRPVRRAGT